MWEIWKTVWTLSRFSAFAGRRLRKRKSCPYGTKRRWNMYSWLLNRLMIFRANLLSLFLVSWLFGYIALSTSAAVDLWFRWDRTKCSTPLGVAYQCWISWFHMHLYIWYLKNQLNLVIVNKVAPSVQIQFGGFQNQSQCSLATSFTSKYKRPSGSPILDWHSSLHLTNCTCSKWILQISLYVLRSCLRKLSLLDSTPL